MDTWEIVRAERTQLISELERLNPAQWDAASLCEGWRVRDVLAHLLQAATATLGTSFTGVLRYGLNLNRFFAEEARRIGERPPAELLEAYRAAVPSTKHPPGARPIHVLVDTVVHSQDIRRPLGLAHAFPAAHLVAVGDMLRGYGFPVNAKRRIRGLRLRATDLDWTAGGGAEVSGPMEALVMAMAGRRAALDDLTGEGKPTLAAR